MTIHHIDLLEAAMNVRDAIRVLEQQDPTAEFGFYRFSGAFATGLKFQPIIEIAPCNDDEINRVGIMLGAPQRTIEKR